MGETKLLGMIPLIECPWLGDDMFVVLPADWGRIADAVVHRKFTPAKFRALARKCGMIKNIGKEIPRG